MEKPDVDLIEGLSPAISIEQKAGSHNPRSTVGTVTEIHDYLRLLYARAARRTARITRSIRSPRRRCRRWSITCSRCRRTRG
jgi:excinuclease UvrABC ATPase subunit